jgi:hypothetical protein
MRLSFIINKALLLKGAAMRKIFISDRGGVFIFFQERHGS